MRVFVTGATGYIGSAVVRTLLRYGHEVTGLVRTPEKGEQLAELGAAPLVGNLRDERTYRSAAAEHDAILHTALEPGPEAVVVDRAVVGTLLDAARESGDPRVVIYTSGVWVLGDTGDAPADENASTEGAAEVVAWRPSHERLILAGATETVTTAVIRPGMVYGGKGGTISGFFATAEAEGAAVFVGDGTNRWSVVHRDDLGDLFHLVMERRGSGIFHGVDGVPLPVAELARAASEAAGAGGAVRSIPLDEARKTLGPVADALVLDQVVAPRRSRELGWRPRHPSFPACAREAHREWKN